MSPVRRNRLECSPCLPVNRIALQTSQSLFFPCCQSLSTTHHLLNPLLSNSSGKYFLTKYFTQNITKWSTRYYNWEWELSISRHERVCDCCHLSASVVVSSCLDEDLWLRLISMPSLGSWPLFPVFLRPVIRAGWGGERRLRGRWKVQLCTRERERFSMWRVESRWNTLHPPGVCFGLMMRSWVARGT